MGTSSRSLHSPPFPSKPLPLRSRHTPFLCQHLASSHSSLLAVCKCEARALTNITQVTELALCSWMPRVPDDHPGPSFSVLHKDPSSHPAMGAALCVLQLTSHIPVPSTTQHTVAFRTWICFVMEVKYSPTSSVLPNLQFVQDEATMWFL